MTTVLLALSGLMVILIVTQTIILKFTRFTQRKYKILMLVVSILVFIGVVICAIALLWPIGQRALLQFGHY